MENLKPIHVFATWQVKEGQMESILNILQTVRAESIREKGNLFYKIHRSNADENTIVLFEGYADEAAIAEHRNTAHYQDLVIGKIIPLLENREVILATPVPE
ncbi:putative quinol monooxygenase [Dyadobacter sp. NIV53]|uniref:putative quinol monooxygenase n=1 Tax=Dyadobacter sp. NIV53 TaxID=2861765 RepID=UPI001C8827A4|nr:putative quinol monooxygenase [Dyadobacter sp. NIV53]